MDSKIIIIGALSIALIVSIVMYVNKETHCDCPECQACPKVKRTFGLGNGIGNGTTTTGGTKGGNRCPPGAKCLSSTREAVF